MRLSDTLTRAPADLPEPPGPVRIYLCGPTVYAAHPRRQRAAVRVRDVAAPLAAHTRLRGAARDQHHGRQRQDLRGRARRERGARAQRDRVVPRGHERPRPRPARLRAPRDGTIPEHVAIIEQLIDARLRLRGRRRRLLPRLALPRVRAAVRPAARQGRGAGAEPAQGGPARLRALEGEQAGRGHLVGLAVGQGPAGLAHRVLGDEREAPRDGVRGARRRARSRLPAPRERARAVPCARPPRSRRSGCTTGCSASAARRCTSRSGTRSRSRTRSRRGGGRRCSSSTRPATGASRSTSRTRRWSRRRRGQRASATSFARRRSRRPRAPGSASPRLSTTTSTRPRRSRSCTSGGDHDLLRRALEIFGLESLAELPEAPPEVVELARERARARAEKRFDDADELRRGIEEAGWIVRDSDAEFQLVPRS